MTELELHLKEIGLLEPVKVEPDTRSVYLEKGYFNDPRNNKGEVPF